MKGTTHKRLLVVFVSAGVLSLLALFGGMFLQRTISGKYERNISVFLDRFYSIETKFTAFGQSDETSSAAAAFLQSIPGNKPEENNIVILDASGSPAYKANDSYLHLANDKINMAWNNLMAMMVDGSDKRYWYKVSWLVDMAVESSLDEIDTAHSTVGISDSPESLNDMLMASDFDTTQNYVSVYQMEKDGATFYLLWLRDKSVDEAIYRAFGKSDVLITPFSNLASLILLLLYWFIAPIWIFLDARRRQTQPLPWALLVLLTNIVGLVVYWIVQSQNDKAGSGPACPTCGKIVHKSHIYCPWCAAPLVKACKGCGKALEREWVACPWCGKSAE